MISFKFKKDLRGRCFRDHSELQATVMEHLEAKTSRFFFVFRAQNLRRLPRTYTRSFKFIPTFSVNKTSIILFVQSLSDIVLEILVRT